MEILNLAVQIRRPNGKLDFFNFNKKFWGNSKWKYESLKPV